MTTRLPRLGDLVLFVAALGVGVLAVAQLRASQHVVSTIESGGATTLALEVGELTRTNAKLRTEITELDAERERLRASLADTKSAADALNTSLEKYEVLLGLRAVHGPGVRMVIEQQLDSTQLLDLINALKSVGVDAMAIADDRVSARTAISGTTFTPPLTITVLGDPLLRDALIRKGGILEQLGVNAQVSEEADLTIPARSSE